MDAVIHDVGGSGDPPADRLLFAQITDIHIGHEPGNPDEGNQHRLDAVLDLLAAMQPRPAFLLATGDLVEDGSVDSYTRLRATFARLPFPVHCCLGNHDIRANFTTIFPETPTLSGRIQYALDRPELRVLMLDTMGDERHGGEFDDLRADWLDAELARDPRPTVLAMHHPPTASGIDWLSADPCEPWVQRLRAIVAKHHESVVAIVAGHYHRPILTVWTHTSMVVCASVSPRAALDLRDMDEDAPDNRAMIVAEPPGFALHLWADGVLTSHLGIAGNWDVLARHNAKTEALVKGLKAERAGIYALADSESAVTAQAA